MAVMYAQSPATDVMCSDQCRQLQMTGLECTRSLQAHLVVATVGPSGLRGALAKRDILEGETVALVPATCWFDLGPLDRDDGSQVHVAVRGRTRLQVTSTMLSTILHQQEQM